jgi:hypothetical protein
MYVYRVSVYPRAGSAVGFYRDYESRIEADSFARAVSCKGYVAAVRLVYSASPASNSARAVA